MTRPLLEQVPVVEVAILRDDDTIFPVNEIGDLCVGGAIASRKYRRVDGVVTSGQQSPRESSR